MRTAAALALIAIAGGLTTLALRSAHGRCAACPPIVCLPTDSGTCPDRCACVASGAVGMCGGR